MITLTTEQQHVFAEHLPEVQIEPDQVTVKLQEREAICFPSPLYPLGNPASIRLHHIVTNGEPLEDAAAMAAYDSIAFVTGRCYTNTEHILDAFEKAGLGDAITAMTDVGSETTPQEGRILYRALIQQFPDHPSYAADGMNARGASRIQEMEAEKKKKKEAVLLKVKKKKR